VLASFVDAPLRTPYLGAQRRTRLGLSAQAIGTITLVTGMHQASLTVFLLGGMLVLLTAVGALTRHSSDGSSGRPGGIAFSGIAHRTRRRRT
jgi:hypothetical protein